MPKALMIVRTQPASAEQEAEYHRWYDEKHLHDVVGIAGIVSATRYKIETSVDMVPAAGGNALPYIAIYELEAQTPEELQEISERMKAALAEGRVDVSSAMDLTVMESMFALPLGDTVR